MSLASAIVLSCSSAIREAAGQFQSVIACSRGVLKLSRSDTSAHADETLPLACAAAKRNVRQGVHAGFRRERDENHTGEVARTHESVDFRGSDCRGGHGPARLVEEGHCSE